MILHKDGTRWTHDSIVFSVVLSIACLMAVSASILFEIGTTAALVMAVPVWLAIGLMYRSDKWPK